MKITNFPTVGENKPVTLENSQFPVAHKNLGLGIKVAYPELWDKVAFKDNQAFKDIAKIRDGVEVPNATELIVAREVILSKYSKNPSPEACLKVLKWHGVSILGQPHMEEAILKMANSETAKKPKSDVVKLTLKSLFSNETKGSVKGFCSVAKIDRGGDYIDPTEFDLTFFKKNPQLLYNHKLWKDANGNEIPVGHISLISPAYIAEQSPQTPFYEVRSYGNELLAIIAKEDFPGLVPYDVGLWVEAVVTVDEVWQKIENKELNGFSWQGLANRVLSEKGRNTLLNVDLIEVSVVHLPANKYASFAISSPVRQVSINKDLFSSLADAQDSLNLLGHNDILDVDGQWVISKDSIVPTFDEQFSKKITLKYLEHSVTNEENKPAPEVKDETKELATEVSEAPKVEPDAAPKEDETVQKSVTPKVSQEYSVLATSFKEVLESSTKVMGIVSKMSDTLEAVKTELATIKKSLEQTDAAPTPEAAKEPEKTIADIIKLEVEAQNKKLANELETVLKSAFVGTETSREDAAKETVSKSNSTNDIFSGLVPFRKR